MLKRCVAVQSTAKVSSSRSCVSKPHKSYSRKNTNRCLIASGKTAAQIRFYSDRYGQPHPLTHPHLLKSNEVTALTTAEEYAERRERLIANLPAGSVVIFPAAMVCYSSNDIPYPYRQNSDFLWLCGFHEPSSVLVIDNLAGKPRTTLFVSPRDPARETWDGPRTGVERAAGFLGIPNIYSVSDVEAGLAPLLDKATAVFFNDIRADVDLHEFLISKGIDSAMSPRPIVEQLRLLKSPSEQELMRRSCAISGQSFEDLMKATRVGMGQRDLEIIFEASCRRQGSQRLAYPPVFASGVSNLTLHYIANDEIVERGQLVLVDAGGEYNCYASDITRTFPASGRFTEAQAELYSAVLKVQKAIIDAVRPSRQEHPVTLNSLHELSVRMLVKELVHLGILTPATVNSYQKYYPHSIGHWLGMDVHDTTSVHGNVPLRPGMVVTVEPGLYIPVDDQSVPERFRGIGIRIEDDVLVREGEGEVLTFLAPKEITHIESIMTHN